MSISTGQREYQHWLDMVPIDTDGGPEPVAALRAIIEWIRWNDLYFRRLQSLLDAENVLYPVSATSGVEIGYLIAFSGGEVVPASLSDATLSPIGVVKDLLSDGTTLWAKCQFRPGPVDIKTIDAMVTENMALYLSETDGQCSQTMPLPVAGTSVLYSVMVGRAMETTVEGLVQAVWQSRVEVHTA